MQEKLKLLYHMDTRDAPENVGTIWFGLFWELLFTQWEAFCSRRVLRAGNMREGVLLDAYVLEIFQRG